MTIRKHCKSLIVLRGGGCFRAENAAVQILVFKMCGRHKQILKDFNNRFGD